MAIVKLDVTGQQTSQKTLPSAIEDNPKTILNTIQPESRIQSLLKYVEGYPWTVNYYGQILAEENTLQHFDPNSPSLAQSYYKVNDLILKVSSPLSSSYDQTNSNTTVQGTSIVPYQLKPNVGDTFIANVDNGEDAIFVVNEVERLTYRKDTVYQINYNLYSYISSEPTYYETLESKVNEVYYYNKDTNYYNKEMLITTTTKEARNRLEEFMYSSKEEYFRTYSKPGRGSIFIPGTSLTMYDPLLLDFITKIINLSELVNEPLFKYPIMNEYLTQPSIYDALLERSLSTLATCNREYVFDGDTYGYEYYRLGAAMVAGVDKVLVPKHPDTTTDISGTDTVNIPPESTPPLNSRNYYLLPDLIVETSNNDQIYSKPLLHGLFIDDYYLVSKNMYDYALDSTGYEDVSYIELLMARYIKREAISLKDLAIAVQDRHKWSHMHKLYLYPVMWLLVKTYL